MTRRRLVLLVHGTWGQRSRWFRKLSSPVFVRALSEENLDRFDADLAYFEWSGLNRWRSRRAAGTDLYSQLRRAERHYDEVHILAHSHGGSVVQEALARHPESTRVVSSLLCLGTPFLFLQPRTTRVTGGWVEGAAFGLFVVPPCLILFGLFGAQAQELLVRFLHPSPRILGLAYLFLVFAVPVLIRATALTAESRAMAFFQDHIDTQVAFTFVRLKTTVATLRSPGDEASSLLNVAHFFGALFGFLFDAFAAASGGVLGIDRLNYFEWLSNKTGDGAIGVDRHRAGTSLLALFSGAGAALAALPISRMLDAATLQALARLLEPEAPESFHNRLGSVLQWQVVGWTLPVLSFVATLTLLLIGLALVYGLLALAVLPFLGLAYLTYGVEAALFSPWLSAYCDSSPFGKSEAIVVPFSGSAFNLRHSLHSSPEGTRAIGEWLEETLSPDSTGPGRRIDRP